MIKWHRLEVIKIDNFHVCISWYIDTQFCFCEYWDTYITVLFSIHVKCKLTINFTKFAFIFPRTATKMKSLFFLLYDLSPETQERGVFISTLNLLGSGILPGYGFQIEHEFPAQSPGTPHR